MAVKIKLTGLARSVTSVSVGLSPMRAPAATAEADRGNRPVPPKKSRVSSRST